MPAEVNSGSSRALLEPAHKVRMALADALIPHDVEYGKSLLPDASLRSDSRRAQDESESKTV